MIQKCLSNFQLLLSGNIKGIFPGPNMERSYDLELEYSFSAEDFTIMENTEYQPLDPRTNTKVTMKAEVRIQSFPDHTLRIKINNASFYIMGEENIVTNEYTVHGSRSKTFGQRIHVDAQFKKYITDPMLVYMKGNTARSFVVSIGEPTCITKIKTSLMKDLKSNGLSPHLHLLKTTGIVTPFRIPNQPTNINL